MAAFDAVPLHVSPSDMVLTPPSSGKTSPTINGLDETQPGCITDSPSFTKKKKKKKPKKPAKTKEAAPASPSALHTSDPNKPSVLCISRNKHWRYISSYHGPWLQLPLELLESLLVLNLDPTTLSVPEDRFPQPSPSLTSNNAFSKASLPAFTNIPLSHLRGRAIPPPIDPGVFRSVTSIRRLIDEAAELSVRATSGLSAVALGSLRNIPTGNGNGHWVAAQSLGLSPMADNSGGRHVTMSPMRVHKLRALAVQKLAQAYKTDEIASSVMVMQGGSVFDNIAEKVLKVDPNDADAKYVHFFHEKIPSRQLAEFTTTQSLDELITAQPQRLEFYRTRGVVHCFRDEYYQAIKDFTFALKEARAVRKTRFAHKTNGSQVESRSRGSKKRKGSNKSHGQAPPNGTSVAESMVEGPDGEALLVHPSVSPDAPDPIEPQLLFLRGAAYLQQAVFLIENRILELEEICKAPTVDGAELRLCYIDNGKYGGVEIGHPDGPLGRRDGEKMTAYRKVLAQATFRDHITMLVKKSMRDHEKFLAHFDSLERFNAYVHDDLASRTERAFSLSESVRPGNQVSATALEETPAMFTTYHPLLVESHFSVLICLLMLGDFTTLLSTFARTALLLDGLEGYPIFLPPRSMAQAEFIETLERLAGGWKNGVQPHSLSHHRHRAHSKAKMLQIEAPPSPPISAKDPTPSPTEPIPSSSSLSMLGEGSSGSTHIPPPSCVVPNSPSGWETPSINSGRIDLVEALDSIRILLAPVAKRQRERIEKASAVTKNGAGAKKNPLTINVPLHGPRVEIILAWLGAVHLYDVDSVV